MGTLSEPQASGDTTGGSPLQETTAAKIDADLQRFDVLPTKLEKHLIPYAFAYILGLYLLQLIGNILLLLHRGENNAILPAIQIIVESALLVVVAIGLNAWTFNVWRLRVPTILQDVFERSRLSLVDGDVNQQYLRFLQHYRHALKNPARYLVIGSPMLIIVIYVIFYHPPLIFSNLVDNILFWISVIFIPSLIIEGGVYYLGILMWSALVSGRYIRKLTRVFTFNIRPLHSDNCGGLNMLGNFCFGLVSPFVIGTAFIIGYSVILFTTETAFPYFYETMGLFLFLFLVYLLPVAIFGFFLPLWNIHTKMLREREADEEHYLGSIETLRQQIEALLDNNQLEAAKTVKDKMELTQALHSAYPTWPFNVKSKFFSVFIGAGTSLLLGVLTGLQPLLVQAIKQFITHKP